MNDVIRELEQELHDRAAQLTRVEAGECSLCYVARMMEEFGCACNLRWATEYVRQCAPRVRQFQDRLGQRGAFCDCEIFLNAYLIASDVRACDAWGEPLPGQTLPPCRGARKGSTKPCSVWVDSRARDRWI